MSSFLCGSFFSNVESQTQLSLCMHSPEYETGKIYSIDCMYFTGDYSK